MSFHLPIPTWVGKNFLTDEYAGKEGLLGFVNPIFKTVGNELGTPVIKTGWECAILKKIKHFSYGIAVKVKQKKAVELFLNGTYALDMLD